MLMATGEQPFAPHRPFALAGFAVTDILTGEALNGYPGVVLSSLRIGTSGCLPPWL